MKALAISLAVVMGSWGTAVYGQSRSQAAALAARPAYAASTYYYGGPYYLPACYQPLAPWGVRMGGAAALIEAQGRWNYLTSEAMKNVEEARRLAIENSPRRVETYFQLREINREALARERAASRSKSAAGRATAANKPKPVLPVLPDAAAHLAWPTALQGEQYAAERSVVKRILDRASANGIGAEDRERMAQTTQVLLAQLKGQVRETSPADYMTAKRFLERLAAEVRSQAG
jgi:hypothetical protein